VGRIAETRLAVVPFSTIAPTSRLEKPSTRVYSSPKPTQPDSSTIGEAEPQAAEIDGQRRGRGPDMRSL